MFSYIRAIFKWSISKLWSKNKYYNILFIGLDNSGKSSLVQLLCNKGILFNTPTNKPNYYEFDFDNQKIKAYDLSGNITLRRLWEEYILSADALVFLVDAYDKDRFNEVYEEFYKIKTNNFFHKKPILVLGNKIDFPTASSKEELKNILGIDESNLNIKLFMCSVIQNYNIKNAFLWLLSNIEAKFG